MKAKTLPLPTPWTIDAAILHLYRCWSNQGQIKVYQITLPNTRMVIALLLLWKRDHQQEWSTQHNKVVSGIVAGIGFWQLLQEPDGTWTIVIEQESDERKQ